jgi:hypothetical protein
MGLRQEDCLSPGVQDQYGQPSEAPSLKKNKNRKLHHAENALSLTYMGFRGSKEFWEARPLLLIFL